MTKYDIFARPNMMAVVKYPTPKIEISVEVGSVIDGGILAVAETAGVDMAVKVLPYVQEVAYQVAGEIKSLLVNDKSINKISNNDDMVKQVILQALAHTNSVERKSAKPDEVGACEIIPWYNLFIDATSYVPIKKKTTTTTKAAK